MEAIVNKKARFNFSIEDTYEAGIVLEGWEVRPIIGRKMNLDASHVIIKDGELFLLNAQIIPEKTTNHSDKVEPTRTRKLLLKNHKLCNLWVKCKKKVILLSLQRFTALVIKLK